MASTKQPSESESWSVGLTLDTQPFADYLTRVLTACFHLFSTSPSDFRRSVAEDMHTLLEKLVQVDVTQSGPVEIILTEDEAIALSLAWSKMAEKEIPPTVVPWDTRFSLILNAVMVDISSIRDEGEPAIGILRLLR